MSVYTAEFRVISFEKNAMDLTARKNDTKLLDVNGNDCAIIKVLTDLKDVAFESPVIERSVSAVAGEYWVYLQKDAKRIKFSREDIDPLIFTFTEKIEESTVYVLKLTAAGIVEAADKVVITVITDPENVNIIFDGQNKGEVRQILTVPGKHQLVIESDGYETLVEEIDVAYNRVLFRYELDEARYVFVEGGTFEMGSSRDSKEKPVHKATVNDFYISKYEVTQEQWKEVMGSTNYKLEDNKLLKSPLYPMIYITWYDAIKFCNKLSEMKGLEPCYSGSGDDIICNFTAGGYRLPTEAEWEYAARGGNESKGFKYSGSDILSDVANYSKRIKKAGSKQPNELGVYDMSGNVSEWCWDWYAPYSDEWHNNPRGPANGKERVVRGGGHSSLYGECTVSARKGIPPDWSDNTGRFYGIRIVRNK
ncbi:MAG: SUMF1/EgtB/PvdO family nonheme iron enzyme [Candidatus Delongbacteria bacterium]|nr:SUMF1/EgtB/PvdO family nonheme iron enzyme [Candidatus Delongbacteria bacterium]